MRGSQQGNERHADLFLALERMRNVACRFEVKRTPKESF